MIKEFSALLYKTLSLSIMEFAVNANKTKKV